MVFNTPVVVGVANLSANACQYIACNPERLPGDQVLYLVFCFPFQQIRRLTLCLWTVFCFSPPLPDPDPDPEDQDDQHHQHHSFYYAITSSFHSSSSSSSSHSSHIHDLHPHLH